MALKGKRALFISYTGMLEPLGQSQVIPYLKELSDEGIEFTLLSFERPNAFTPEGQQKIVELAKELADSNIDWRRLRYHKRFSIVATAYDVLRGIGCASSLVKSKRIEVVHARSHIPATIALALKRRFGVKMIFDIRGLMAEEYVDAGNWQEGDTRYRITKSLERRAFAASDGVVTLTNRIWNVVSEWEGLRGRDVPHQVVPCCVDLEKFTFRQEDRNRRRVELKLDDQFVLLYSGSIGGWYYTGQMIDFFSELLKQEARAHFLWLTMGDRSMIDRLMEKAGIKSNRYTVMAVNSDDVPSYLSVGDAGIAFYKPSLSRFATSPVKVAEYLACGLPVLINQGIGDLEELVGREDVGVITKGFAAADFSQAVRAAKPLLNQESHTRERARAVAERNFDVRDVGRSRYKQLYTEVLSS
jgi:glycosyltransferase involved in cell wall biosynthesis